MSEAVPTTSASGAPDADWIGRAAAHLPRRGAALPRALVAGLGKTGFSVVRHLRRLGAQVAVTDSRAAPPEAARLAALADAGSIVVRAGALDASLLESADFVVVSPGLPMTGAFFEAARARALPMFGDIELFAQALAGGAARVAAITGTNGKSTVTTLLTQMAARAGLAVRAGGNLGAPALDLIDPAVQLYVLELSSFQLETTESLRLAAGAVLNVTPDHLDRYPDIDAYAAAKARIFIDCARAVVNLDDPRVARMAAAGSARLTYSLRADSGADYALASVNGESWLARRGEPWLPLAAMKLAGRHNAANALATLALGEALGLARTDMLAELREFPGLPHRTAWVRDLHGVRYVNDSKGTNVGATLAAVDGLDGPLLVIAGGEGKGQDFTPLRAAFAGKVRAVLLIGRDAPALRAALQGVSECRDCASLDEAVRLAARLARSGDTVLLSPACASLDMFRDYAQRGEEFVRAVRELAA